MFNHRTILLTGGTGSFGLAFSEYILKKFKPKKLIIFSRDENKQYLMQQNFTQKNIRFFLGDVRDLDRLRMAMRTVDFVFHAAAQKHVPIAEYNPIECVKTNVTGAQNIITSAIECKVKKVILLSTDKATNPINLYGATKLAAEKLFLSAHSLVGKQNTVFGVVRYGNVINSRGSIIPLFKKLEKEKKPITITNPNMTRFFLNLEDSVKFVIKSIELLKRNEIYVPKMYSLKIIDLAKTIAPKSKIKIIGMRSGEKLHEFLCSIDESYYILENKDFYIIFQNKQDLMKYKNRSNLSLKQVPSGFYYSSNNNKKFLSLEKIKPSLNIY